MFTVLPGLLIFFSSAIVVAVALSRRGKCAEATLSEPRCAKCNYDLRGFTGTVPVRCSECGADLTARHAIVWGTYPRKPARLWLVFAFGALFPLVVLMVVFFNVRSRIGVVTVTTAIFPGSPAFNARPTPAVIASLSTSANTPWDWQELDRRQASGKLSDAEIAQAIDQLIAFLKKQPVNQPLNWQSPFLTSADSAGKITAKQYDRLARAFYKPATISIARTIRSGARLPVVVHSGEYFQLPGAEFVYALRLVTMDGKAKSVVAMDQYPDRHPANPDYLSAMGTSDIYGSMIMDVPAGDHMLGFTIDSAVLQEKTAPQIGNNKPGQADRWPRGRAMWSDVITLPIKVIPSDQSPITLVTDPAFNPRRTGAIHLKTIRIIRSGDGVRATADLSIDGTSMPCSFDVRLRIAGQEHAMGSIVTAVNSSSSSWNSCDLPSLNESVQTADVLLRPSPAHAEGVPGIDHVWGGPIDLLDIPLQRYDLPSK